MPCISFAVCADVVWSPLDVSPAAGDGKEQKKGMEEEKNQLNETEGLDEYCINVL